MPLITGPTTDAFECLVGRTKDPRLLVEAVYDMASHAEGRIRSLRGVFHPYWEGTWITGITRDWLEGRVSIKTAHTQAERYTHFDTSQVIWNTAEGDHYGAICRLTRMLEDLDGDLADQVISAALDCRQAVAHAIFGPIQIPQRSDEEGEWQITHLESLLVPYLPVIEGRLRNSPLAD